MGDGHPESLSDRGEGDHSCGRRYHSGELSHLLRRTAGRRRTPFAGWGERPEPPWRTYEFISYENGATSMLKP